MKIFARSLTLPILVFGLLSTGCGSSGGEESSMFGGGPTRTGVYVDSGPNEKPDVKWTFQTKDEISSSPAVAGDAVYIGSEDQNLYAIDIETGERIWGFQANYTVSSSPAFVELIREDKLEKIRRHATNRIIVALERYLRALARTVTLTGYGSEARSLGTEVWDFLMRRDDQLGTTTYEVS